MTDPNHQKHSGYYHFASTGTKYVNKWDSFDADAEIEKIDGTTNGSGSGGGKKQDAVPTLDTLTRQARQYAVELKALLFKRLDGITHEMANNPELIGNSHSLKKKRQRLCKLLNDKLVPRAEGIVATISKIRKERDSANAKAKSSGGAATTGANGGRCGGLNVVFIELSMPIAIPNNHLHVLRHRHK